MRKFMCVMLILCMLLGLAACVKEDSDDISKAKSDKQTSGKTDKESDEQSDAKDGDNEDVDQNADMVTVYLVEEYKVNVHDGEYSDFLKIEYDDHGNRMRIYGNENGLNLEGRYEYGSNGNVIREVYLSENTETGKREYKYDNAGNKIEEVYIFVGSETITEKYEYDQAGNLIKYVSYSGETEDHRYEYQYDGSGNMEKEDVYYDGAYSHGYIYQYNGSGKVIIEQYFSSPGYCSGTVKYTYDGYDNLIKEESYRSVMEDPYYYREYQYDIKGNLIREVSYYDGELYGTRESEYNSDGVLLSETTISPSYTHTETVKWKN